MRPSRAALPLVVLLLAAACGGGSGLGAPDPGRPSGTATSGGGADELDRTDASAVLTAGVTSTLAAPVVRVHGAAREGSLYSPSTRSNLEFDLVVDAAGSCDGTVTEQRSGAARIRVVGTHSWLRGSSRFWHTVLAGRAPSSSIDVLVGKWVESDQGDLRKLCDLPTILRDGHAASDVVSTLVLGDSPADVIRVLVTYADGAAVTYSVDAAAPHHLTHLISAAGDAAELDLTYGGRPVKVRPPPADEVLTPGTVNG